MRVKITLVERAVNASGIPTGSKLAEAELHFDGSAEASQALFVRHCAETLATVDAEGQQLSKRLRQIADDMESRSRALDGLKLAGFSVWEQQAGRRVTFPARQYTVNGERRSIALLRPADAPYPVRGDSKAYDRVREAILEAYAIAIMLHDQT